MTLIWEEDLLNRHEGQFESEEFKISTVDVAILEEDVELSQSTDSLENPRKIIFVQNDIAEMVFTESLWSINLIRYRPYNFFYFRNEENIYNRLSWKKTSSLLMPLEKYKSKQLYDKMFVLRKNEEEIIEKELKRLPKEERKKIDIKPISPPPPSIDWISNHIQTGIASVYDLTSCSTHLIPFVKAPRRLFAVYYQLFKNAQN